MCGVSEGLLGAQVVGTKWENVILGAGVSAWHCDSQGSCSVGDLLRICRCRTAGNIAPKPGSDVHRMDHLSIEQHLLKGRYTQHWSALFVQCVFINKNSLVCLVARVLLRGS